jgi:hypothetical protein
VAAIPAGRAGAALTLASPWTLFSRAFDARYAADPQAFWTAALLVHLLGWLWLGLASFFLPRAWQEKARARGGVTWRPTAPGITKSPVGAGSRIGKIREDPICWLAARSSELGRLPWWLALPAAASALLIGGVFLGQMVVLMGVWGCALGLHLLFAVGVAWETCHFFAGLRRSGMLELLLVTPLSTAGLVQAQEKALRRQFLGPVVLIAATEYALLLGHALFRLTHETGFDFLALMAIAWVCLGSGLVIWVTDMLAAAKVGLWMGLGARRPATAWARTVVYVLVGPWLLSLVPGILCFGFTSPVMLFIKNLVFITWAGSRLQSDLRATLHTGGGRAHWMSAGGP